MSHLRHCTSGWEEEGGGWGLRKTQDRLHVSLMRLKLAEKPEAGFCLCGADMGGGGGY